MSETTQHERRTEDEPESEDGITAEVVVLDYGLGNLRSVTRGLERAGAAVEVTAEPDFEAFDGIVLPGVGAFREGVENAGPYREALIAAAEKGTPVFGICLGMQMLMSTSEEAATAGQGEVTGLDLIPGENVRFRGERKVPHMGWNELSVEREHPLVEDVNGVGPAGRRENGPAGGSVDGEHAYFVHSYYAVPDREGAVVATTDYGIGFASVIANPEGTVFGTQFHPEKSGETGLKILRNFITICAG
jgi:glutamine amidotransferase